MEEDYGTAKWVEREDAHARQVLSTAKVVVTFSLPLAATFVVAAMQNNDKARWSEISAGLLILAVIYTIRVLRKRKSELGPDDSREEVSRHCAGRPQDGGLGGQSSGGGRPPADGPAGLAGRLIEPCRGYRAVGRRRQVDLIPVI